MFRTRLKFYADTPKGEKNKYFCWEIRSILDVKQRIIYFLRKKYNIRAAWFENINTDTGEVIQNSKIDIDAIIDEILDAK